MLLRLFISTAIIVFIVQVSAQNAKIPTGYSFVPSGEYTLRDSVYRIQSFFISVKPITYKQYNQFVNTLKQKGENEKLKIATLNTIIEDENKPVLSISKEAAELYCIWLTETLNEKDKKYNRFRLPFEVELLYADKSITPTMMIREHTYCQTDSIGFRPVSTYMGKKQ